MNKLVAVAEIEKLSTRLLSQTILASTEALENYKIFKEGINFCLSEVKSLLDRSPTVSEASPPVEVEPVAKLRFPVMLRKMWSGSEVQQWLDENYNNPPTPPETITISKDEYEYEVLKADAERIAQQDEIIAELVNKLERVIGSHLAPEHCYSTGPLTGTMLDVICPSCDAIDFLAKVKGIK